MTTISVSKDTRDKLKAIGKKGDSYEDIILMLLNYWQKEKEE